METMHNIEDMIGDDMSQFFGLILTDEQIKDIQDKFNFKYFDTVERDECIDYIVKKITGRAWPLNGDSEEYKKQFYADLKEGAGKLGYTFKEK